MEFKDRLKARRTEMGLTQAELAHRAGVTTRTIQNYETGNRKPQHMEIVQKLANALETRTDTLLGSTGTYVIDAYEKGGARAAHDVDALVSEISGLFAGGELDQQEKDGIIAALNEAYWIARKENLKYAPKHSAKAGK